MSSHTLRLQFLRGLLAGLRVVWPVLSGLVGLIIVLGLFAGEMEEWPVPDSIYFSFISALTIGYGDLAPKAMTSRALAILIGLCGVLLTAVVAAVAVKALPSPRDGGER